MLQNDLQYSFDIFSQMFPFNGNIAELFPFDILQVEDRRIFVMPVNLLTMNDLALRTLE